MVKHLRTRLVGGYLLVVVIFAIFGSIAFWRMLEVNRATERFIGRHWMTADLVMDLRNAVNEASLAILMPPPDLDREALLWRTRQELLGYRNRLPATLLDSANIAELQNDLLQFERIMVDPLQLAGLPARRMQEADRVAERVLQRAERAGDPELLHLLRLATMTFNDVLSTHDPAELERFRRLLQRVEAYPRQPLPAEDLAEFREAGLEVFTAESRLRGALDRFEEVRRSLQASLDRIEDEFERGVVEPEERRVLGLIGTALATLASVLSLGVFTALLAGSLVARSVSRPLERTIGMVRSLAEGDLAVRLHMGRRDEIGQMADALDAFADTLQNALVALSGTIASQRRTARELQESERKYRSLAEEFEVLLEGIPDSLALLGPDRRVLWANSAAARQAGRPPMELPGLPCAELTGAPPEQAAGCVVERCFRDGEIVDEMVRLVDGRILGIKAFPLGRSEQGTVDRVIRLAADITERVRLREEAIGASRLAALGELSAGMAHEINNPNALTLYNVPILLECFRELGPILEEHRRRHGDFTLAGLDYAELHTEVPELLREVLDGARRIQRIVEDLKNFVRREEADEAQAPFDLNEAVRAAVRLAGPLIRQATDRFETALDPDLPDCRGIPQKIEQVVINLLQNACQALPDRDRMIAVSTGRDPRSGMNVVTVRDEGQGIEEKDLTHLTDPFFTTRRSEGGTGLGLSISARIVQEHDGRLEFASAPGRGTTAKLYLPVGNETNGEP